MLGKPGEMPLQGHLVSVASLHLYLLITWKVKTRLLPNNLIPRRRASLRAPPDAGPWPGHGQQWAGHLYQLLASGVPLGFSLPRSTATTRQMLRVSPSSSHAYVSSLSKTRGPEWVTALSRSSRHEATQQ